MYIKNVDALEQLRDLVIGIKELPYIKRVAIHGSSLIKENINDIDLVIIFNNEFDFENGNFSLNQCQGLLTLIKKINNNPYHLDITYTTEHGLLKRATYSEFYKNILYNSKDIYNSSTR